MSVRNQQIQLPGNEQKIAAMFNRIAPRYDFLNRLLSMRQDIRWRNALIASIPYRPGGFFLDVATGTGDVILGAARAHPEYRSLKGVDISANMLELARIKTHNSKFHERLSFELMSAEKIEIADSTAACVSISFGLRNVVNREVAIQEFYRVLEKDGKLLVLEFFIPTRGLFALLFQLYFRRILPWIGGLFSDSSAYTYLPQSVGGFYSIEQLCDKIKSSGFSAIRVKRFMFGSCALLEATKAR